MPRWLAALGVAIAIAEPARAGVGDVFGLGPEIMGMAGAGSALSDGPWAAHNAPAGLAFATAGRLSLGVIALGSQLEIGGSSTPIEDPVGILAGISVVRRLEGPIVTSVGFGIAAHLVPGTLGHVHQRTPETPFFLCYDNRTQRAMLLPALAVGLGGKVALGLSLDVFAGIEGPLAAREGQSGEVESSLFLDIVTTIRPTPSIVVRPGAGLSFALTYHPQFSVPYELDVDAGIPGLDMTMHVSGRALYTPHTLVLGAAWRSARIGIALDLSWAAWSLMGSPFVEVEARILEIGLLAPSNPTIRMSDAFGVRLGIEAKVLAAGPVDLVLRAGYGYESPVVGEQTGRSNLMDGHKHTWALGLGTGWTTGRESVPRVLVDLHVGGVVLSRLAHHKIVSDPADGRNDPTLIVDEDETTPGIQVTNPGYPSISGGGWITTAAFTITLEVR